VKIFYSQRDPHRLPFHHRNSRDNTYLPFLYVVCLLAGNLRVALVHIIYRLVEGWDREGGGGRNCSYLVLLNTLPRKNQQLIFKLGLYSIYLSFLAVLTRAQGNKAHFLPAPPLPPTLTTRTRLKSLHILSFYHISHLLCQYCVTKE
jgi:hypothetical protein